MSIPAIRAGDEVLVIGANGFLGRYLSEELAHHGCSVRGFDRYSTGLPSSAVPGVVPVKGDFQNNGDLAASLDGVDYVCHFLSMTTPANSATDPSFDIRTNVLATLEMIALSERAGVRGIIFASSGGTVYGAGSSAHRETDALRPISPYGIGKVAIEQFLDYYRVTRGLDSTSLRISNPYGSRQQAAKRQGFIPIALRAIRDGRPITRIGDGNMRRDFIHAEDLTSMIVRLVLQGSMSDEYNLGSGKGVTIAEVINTMRAVTNETIDVDVVPQPPYFVKDSVLNTARYISEYGEPVVRSLREGIKQTWEDLQHGG